MTIKNAVRKDWSEWHFAKFGKKNKSFTELWTKVIDAYNLGDLCGGSLQIKIFQDPYVFTVMKIDKVK